MKRQIIKIDEQKCNGCGLCATACAEGAIQMVDGKAHLISEVFCDGLGACLGECPVGAITVEERDAEPYNERKTLLENLLPQGMEVVRLHLEHLKSHGQDKLYNEALAVLKERGIEPPEGTSPTPTSKSLPTLPTISIGQTPAPNNPPGSMKPDFSLLGEKNWPIQLQLINPASTVFDGADLIIAADCTAFAMPDFYQRFTLKGKLIVFCPKLDQSTDHYIEKLAAIFSQHEIRSITVLRMTVPCCGGTSVIVQRALERSGKTIPVRQAVVAFDGTVQ